jgi:hypothetical protein
LVNAVQTSLHGFDDVYLARFNPSYTGLDFSTYLGHSGFDGGARLGTDAQRRIHVAAWCVGTGGLPLIHAHRGPQPLGQLQDAWLMRLQPDGAAIQYATHVGGVPYGINDLGFAVGHDGTVVLGSWTASPNWPHVGVAPVGGGPSDAGITVFAPDVLPSYGTGTPGTDGFVPCLSGGGVSSPGNTIRLQVFHGLAPGIGVLGFGTGAASLPLFGGSLWITPPFATVTMLLTGPPAVWPWPNGGGGYATFDLAIPPNPLLSGSSLFVQGAFVDGGAPGGGISLTNAVNATIQ